MVLLENRTLGGTQDQIPQSPQHASWRIHDEEACQSFVSDFSFAFPAGQLPNGKVPPSFEPEAVGYFAIESSVPMRETRVLGAAKLELIVIYILTRRGRADLYEQALGFEH